MRMPSAQRAALFAVALAACYGTEPVGYEFSKQDGEGVLGAWVHSGLYTRLYELHTPPNVDDGELHPLIIFLHGAGDTGPSFRRRLDADDITDAGGFVTVWPDGLQGTWTVGCGFTCTFAEALDADDDTFLVTLVRHLSEELPVDTTRVYLLGYSQGGQLAHLYGCRSPSPPAGIGVVAAEMYRALAQDCDPNGPFPVGIVHGDADPIFWWGGFGPDAALLSVPATVDTWRRLWRCGDQPTNEIRPDTAGDYTYATVFRYSGCAAGSSLVLYQVHGGGHTWPGQTGPWPVVMGPRSRNLDATRELLALFASTAGGASAPGR